MHPGHFAEYALGLHLEPFHWDWFEHVLGQDRGVLLAARGHAKSTYLSVVLPLWMVGRNPNLRVAVCSASAGQSEKFLRDVGDHIQHNPRFREVFGDLYDPNQVWTQKQKTVRRSKVQKDSSFMAVGVGSGFAGARTDVLIFDDLVDDTNSKTAHRRAEVLRWVLKTALPTLDPTGPQIAWMACTPYHFDDATQHLGKIWPCFAYPAEDEGGNILWPSRFPREELDRRRQEAGEHVYATQYLVRPVGLEGNRLLRVWLHESPEELGEVDELLGVDWAVVPEEETENYERDYTAISHFKIAPWGLEINAFYRFQLALPDTIEYLKQLIGARPRIRKIGCEKTGIGLPGIQMLQRVTSLPLIPVPAATSMISRMEVLSPYFASGKITLARGDWPGREEFIYEWVGFPYVGHDDMLASVDVGAYAHGFGGVSFGSVEVQ